MTSRMWPRTKRGRLSQLTATLADANGGEQAERLIRELMVGGENTELELVADTVVSWVQHHGQPDTARRMISLASEAYMFAMMTNPDRMDQIGAKGAAVQVLLDKFQDATASSADPPKWDDETVVRAVLVTLHGRGGTGQVTRDDLRRLHDVAVEAQDRNIQFALCLARWMREQTTFAWSDEAEHDRARTGELEADCLQRMAALEERLGLEGAALDSLVQLAHSATYRTRRWEESVHIAAAALELGRRHLESVDGDLARLVVLDQLARISRLTRDTGEVAEWTDRFCRHQRSMASACERNRDWITAADRYSNLGYRSFSAAEYTGLHSLYQQAGYSFEKAEALRAKAGGGQAEYRRREATGFIQGAAARQAEPARAADMYDAAAAALDRAAQLTFQEQPGLSLFYEGTAQFFTAQAALSRAASAHTIAEIRRPLAGAAGALLQCFSHTQQVFWVYRAVLAGILDGHDDPCPNEQIEEMTRTLHPHAAQVADTARAVSTALAAGDVDAARTVLASLATQFVFLNPLD